MKVAQFAITSARALAASTSTAAADMAIGLVRDNTLAMIDASKPAVANMVKVEGAGKMLGVNDRPSNKLRHGVSEEGTVMTIDVNTGTASLGRRRCMTSTQRSARSQQAGGQHLPHLLLPQGQRSNSMLFVARERPTGMPPSTCRDAT